MAWLAFRDRLYDAVCEAGYDDLQPAQLLLFRYPTIDGLRPGQLADQAGMSKQAVNDLLRQLEALGYLRLERDPADGRARLIRFTPRGDALWDYVFHAVAMIAGEWKDRIGHSRFEEFAETLHEIAGMDDAR